MQLSRRRLSTDDVVIGLTGVAFVVGLGALGLAVWRIVTGGVWNGVAVILFTLVVLTWHR